jgi:hypothetical protein
LAGTVVDEMVGKYKYCDLLAGMVVDEVVGKYKYPTS